MTFANAGENPTVTLTLTTSSATVADVVVRPDNDDKASYTPEEDLADGRYTATVTVTRTDGKRVERTWSFTVGEQDFQLYFGQLHSHTTYSDGSVPVARLPLMAARVGLDAMAISDHDTLRSVQYAYDHPVQDGVKLIPATELTGYDYERQHRVHLLAYWPDPESEALRRHCDIMRQRRNECCLQSARELEAIFPQFRTEQALEYARDSGVLYKSGIMQALRELGLADSIYGERYHELFGWNPRGRVLHSPEYIPVREVLATARAAGAVVVFAHPTVYKSMPLLRELVREGMVDGIEIDHPSNSPEDKAECAALCGQYHLIHTGGTDFHGANHKKVYPVGTCTTPDDQIARIEELARKRKK